MKTKDTNKFLRAYLAGPDVFLPDPLSIAKQKKELCSKYGIEGVFPLDAELDLSNLSKSEQGLRISLANENLIRSCSLVIANITPFRGPSLDVGTAFEIGFARGIGLPVYAYSNDVRKFSQRTREYFYGDNENAPLVDLNGMSIENFDLVDNLMIDGGVAELGVILTGSVDDMFTSLDVFEKCLQFIEI